MIIAFTGHRLNKLGGYDNGIFNRLVDLGTAVIKKYNPTKIISGMALGWDQACAVAAINLSVPFIAAIPFYGQESRWPENAQKKYFEILDCSYEKIVIGDIENFAYSMQLRNIWMVDNSDFLIALWDGSKGGTHNCIKYAESKNREYINLWESWVKYR